MKIIEKRKNGTTRVATLNEHPSKTDQSQKQDCDVNYIVAKYRKTGQITHLAKRRGYYADVSTIPDLTEALSIVSTASDAFNALPSQLRKRFGNDPQEMIAFLQDPSNLEESIKLGLRNAPPKVQEELPTPDRENLDRKQAKRVSKKNQETPPQESEE